jgi:hypothetical protein
MVKAHKKINNKIIIIINNKKIIIIIINNKIIIINNKIIITNDFQPVFAYLRNKCRQSKNFGTLCTTYVQIRW